MKIKYYENDLPEGLDLGNIVAIDTETMGLNPKRDRLCLVQLSSGNGICYLVKIMDLRKKPKNLLKLLINKKIQKIFHFARFDVAVLKYTYKINIKNIYLKLRLIYFTGVKNIINGKNNNSKCIISNNIPKLFNILLFLLSLF